MSLLSPQFHRKGPLKAPDASARRLSDLRAEMNQRWAWANYAESKGKHHEASVHRQKSEAARKALATLTKT